MLDLDDAVDVVRFDSFSNLRKRIRVEVGPDGHSKERTFDGTRHVELDPEARATPSSPEALAAAATTSTGPPLLWRPGISACSLRDMGHVTSLFARKMVAAGGSGIDSAALLYAAGIDPDGRWYPKAMIPAESYYDMLNASGRRSTSPTCPCAPVPRCVWTNTVPLDWHSRRQRRSAGSLRAVERYARLWNSASWNTNCARIRAGHALHPAPRRREAVRPASVDEATLASAISIARQVSPVPVTPVQVFVRHGAPGSVAAHEAWFGCSVQFDAGIDAILFSPETLAQPNILGDEGISRYLGIILDAELAEIAEEVTLVSRAKGAIAQALNEGSPRMVDIARALGLSARSFHRRLSEHGVSFQTLTEETRRDLAVGLLKDEQHSLRGDRFPAHRLRRAKLIHPRVQTLGRAEPQATAKGAPGLDPLWRRRSRTWQTRSSPEAIGVRDLEPHRSQLRRPRRLQ